MRRNVYLQGELGAKFGNKFIVKTDNYSEILRCINANRPEFLNFIRKCHEQNIGFTIQVADRETDYDDLLLPIQEGDVTIAIVPAGAKSGVGKILAAIALVVLMSVIPVPGMEASLLTAEGLTGFAAFAQKVGYALVTNLALTGIQQIMAPDPATDQDEPTNYLFSGDGNNAKEGDPIPLLYGELRVPGRPISINIINGGRPGNNNLAVTGSGDMNQIGGAMPQHH